MNFVYISRTRRSATGYAIKLVYVRYFVGARCSPSSVALIESSVVLRPAR